MEEEKISFHTPGHKGKNILIEWGKYIPYIDTTELENTDNLLEPTGIIRQSQEMAAQIFGSKATYYGVNGSTGNIYIAMSTITDPGDKVLVERNCHKSVYNSLILNRLDPVYIYPNYNEKYNLFTGLHPKDIEEALRVHPDIKAVIITYPNYYGICSDIEAIEKIVHRHGKILMVDEAHGSHLNFSNRLPISSLKVGADIVIHSTHKTLPSFTQTSMLHVGSGRIDLDKLRDRYNLYTTTSPSYLFILSNEIAIAYMMDKGREDLDRNISEIDRTIELMNNMARVHVFTGDSQDNTIADIDRAKLLFRVHGITGTRLNRILSNDYGIDLEMADYYYGLALTSVMNTKEDYRQLVNAIEDISQRIKEERIRELNIDLLRPDVCKNIYEAYYSEREIIDIEDSIGRISAGFIIPYPPGIPLIVPGEKITLRIYDYIQYALENKLEILGLIGYNKDQIGVIK